VVRPWDNRGKCHMEEKRIQCLSNPSIFNRFPVIQPVISKGRYFSTFFAHFGLLWVRHLDNRSKCYIDGKRIQCCWLNASQHVPIYLQPFTSYSEILVGNCNFFPAHLHLTLRWVFPLEIWGKVWSSEN